MIDLQARQRLYEDRKLQTMMKGFASLMESQNGKKDDGKTLTFKMKEEADPQEITQLEKLGKGLAVIANLVKGIRIDIPDVFHIRGSVSVENMPPVQVSNLQELSTSFKRLEDQLSYISQALSAIHSTDKNEDTQAIIRTLSKGLSALDKSFASLSKKIGDQKPVEVGNLSLPDNFTEMMRDSSEWSRKLYEFEVNKITLAPPTVTNVNINALNGQIKTSAATVTSVPTGLPSYGVLANRRSLVMYNNDASTTIYYGGSDVSASTGVPVPPNSYSPILDVGPTIVPFAVTTGVAVNVRIMEISNSAKGM